jgi:hypothetical protein
MDVDATGDLIALRRKGAFGFFPTMDRFLNEDGVFDDDYERAAREDFGLVAVLLPGRQPTNPVGSAMVIVDSSTAR